MSVEATAETSFVQIEEGTRRFWRRRAVPEAVQASRRGGEPFVIYQQPLAVERQRPTDQTRLLATVDLLARYQTMRGADVRRSIGWACQGLPVEVAVEESLGLRASDSDPVQFNAACRNVAVDGIRRGEALAERLGVWLDTTNRYMTMSPQAVGTVWGALRRLWDKGHLRQEQRIAPICPRCATPLSEAEASRVLPELELPIVWVLLPWEGKARAYFLVHTPIPWTLIGMVALAVHPEATYALVELSGHEGHERVQVLLAETAIDDALLGKHQLIQRLTGKSLQKAGYQPLFTLVSAESGGTGIILSRDVPVQNGTGLMAVTPAFDELSLTLARHHDLHIPRLLDDWGRIDDSIRPLRGLSPWEAQPLVVEDLQARGLLFRYTTQTRRQTACPYCRTTLLPLAHSVWTVDMPKGTWLVGRDRLWGTPLPVWTCEGCGDRICLAGLDDLAHRSGIDTPLIDPHRPAIDTLTFPCERCGAAMHRVEAVVDEAFVAAVLPWSTTSPTGLGPVVVGLDERVGGWPDTLEATASILAESPQWQVVLLPPESPPGTGWTLEAGVAADALRWASCAAKTPGQAEDDFLRPVWQLAMSQTRDNWLREGIGAEILDRWLKARFEQGMDVLTSALNCLDPFRAASELTSLVDEVSFWMAGSRLDDGLMSLLGRLLAPFVPHTAEAIYRHAGGAGADSVYLADWPVPDPTKADPDLLARLGLVKRMVMLGQQARARAGMELTEELRRAQVGSLWGDSSVVEALGPFREFLATVLSVAQVDLATEAPRELELQLGIKSERAVERSIAKAEIETVLANLDAEEAASLASGLRAGLSVGLQVAGQAITLLPDEVSIVSRPRPGQVAAADTEIFVLYPYSKRHPDAALA